MYRNSFLKGSLASEVNCNEFCQEYNAINHQNKLLCEVITCDIEKHFTIRHFKSKESRYRYPVLFNALFAMSYKTIGTLIDNAYAHACFFFWWGCF